MTRLRYQDISGGDIPEVTDDDGTRVRVICGSFWGKAGPVEGVAADPRYLDVWVPPGKRKSLPVETSGHAFAYVFEGGGTFREDRKSTRLNSSHSQISYAVFCLKKKKTQSDHTRL